MRSPVLTIVGVYAVLATFWVLGSDRAVHTFVRTDHWLAQSVKGVGFVLVTSFVLFVFLRRAFSLYGAKERALNSALNRLRQSEGDLRSILDNLPDAFYRSDMEGTLLMVSPHFAQEFGYEMHEVIGSSLAGHHAEPEGRDQFLAALHANGGCIHQYRAAMRKKDGSLIWVSINSLVRRDETGRPVGIEGIARNVTAQHELENQLRFLASHDMLTGLCNRIRFEDRLNHAIARARRDGQTVALLYMDLDGFKTINDTHGHQMGDQILIAVARRLKVTLRESDTLARMGGDEFAVLLEGGVPGDAAGIVAQKVADAIKAPLPGLVERVSASVGIAFFPQDGADGDSLLKSADQAMYRAKRLSKAGCEPAVG